MALTILALFGVQHSAWAASAVEQREPAVAHDRGLPHDESTHDEDPCADDGCSCDGPCSPTCDDCACSLGGRTLPAQAQLTELSGVLVAIEPALVAHAATPPSPALAGVFHPPRR